ncbi:D-serine ammonia-lyase [Fictibacillus sp. Mic-4]|uniref:D-serine ammonia-lyase n=1 Tax=Fictibacillus sp. Mic-4 TaxID=3132826 RepID=UPI003CF086E4
METHIVHGKTLNEWKNDHPELNHIMSTKEVFWLNPKYGYPDGGPAVNEGEMKEAEERLKRFAPYIAEAFPETRETDGIIESPLQPIPKMKRQIEQMYEVKIEGDLWLKCDSHLPISGSIKARGGIYEVLKHAEHLAIEHGLLRLDDNYSAIATDRFRRFFSNYSIAVGSTGNLGLSIGIISAKLGFHVTVHMSADAKQWKKDLLRSKGVTVVEYEEDYSKAVAEGRKQAEKDPNCYFIDDENSKDLFLGYSVAAPRLKRQLNELKVTVDKDHPLFVYLPCGVGGGPGGIAYGLKQMYGGHVHCFFAEPTHSPCMLLGLMTGLYDHVSVQDFGIDNRTDADGLAVGRPSGFVCRTVRHLLRGIYTVNDNQLYKLLSTLIDAEQIPLEPSALAGAYGPIQLFKNSEGQRYVAENDLQTKMRNATHIVWATGGSMVPPEVMEEYARIGRSL